MSKMNEQSNQGVKLTTKTRGVLVPSALWASVAAYSKRYPTSDSGTYFHTRWPNH
jgi:hypothetical protein